MQKLRDVWKENKRLRLMVGYGIFYLICFFLLESREVPIYVVSCKWDQYIPFCEYFVIPYFYWFVYMAFAMVYFVLLTKNEEESKKFLLNFVAGMTIFLLVSFLYPNGHTLRPELVRDNLCTKIVGLLHSMDTPTNILPSMHVYVTVACSIALLRQKELRRCRGFQTAVWLSGILIVLSTVFLKQHSVVDVILALLLNLLCYGMIYKKDWRRKKVTAA